MKNNIEEKKCSCGNNYKSKYAIHECTHTGWGWFFHSMGISAKPVKVSFKCINCNELISETEDEEICREYVGR